MLNGVLVLELVSLALIAGLLGLVCGYFIAGALLPDVAAILARALWRADPGHLTLKPQWWIAGVAISITGALAAAAASLTKALRLPLLATAQPHAWQQAQRRWLTYQSALALAAFAAARMPALVRRFPDFGFCRARGADARRGADPADVSGIACCRSASAMRGRPVSVWFWADSRQQLSGLSLALDGAAARACGQCRRLHHGRELQPHLSGLARRAAGRGCLCQRRQRRAGGRDQGVAARASRGARRSCPAAAPIRNWRARRSRCWACPITPLYRDNWPLLQSTARMPGSSFVPAMPRSSASNWRGALNLSIGDRIEVPAPGGQLAARRGRHLCGLRQPQGPDRGQLRRADAALSEIPQTRMGLRVAPPRFRR